MLKTKFEAIDPEVIEYEEDVHGPTDADHRASIDESGADLEKMSTASSAETIEEEDGAVAGAEKK